MVLEKERQNKTPSSSSTEQTRPKPTMPKLGGGMDFEAPRKDAAIQYIEKHRLDDLFRNMTSMLLYHRPENPKSYMANYLEKLMSKSIDKPYLFDSTNIESIFHMMDPVGRGYISLQQYHEAMKSIGVTNYNREPVGYENDQITFVAFMQESAHGIRGAASTFPVP